MENIAILMPHRYFINKNLSMESEKLRSRIDEYSIKYESKIQSYQMEIERIQAENEQEYIKISESLINDFKQDSDSLDDLQKELFEFVELYLKEQLLLQKKEYNFLMRETKQDYSTFLRENISNLKDEIQLLEERKVILSLKTDISKTLELIILSDSELKFDSQDIREILKAIKEEISNTTEDNWIKKNALLHLNRMIYESFKLYETIQYIDWIVKQKKIARNKFIMEKTKIEKELKDISKTRSQLKNEIIEVRKQMDRVGRNIRLFWVTPILKTDREIAVIQSKISKLYSGINQINKEREKNIEEKDTVTKKIESIKNNKENDESWDELWEKKRSLSRIIYNLKSDKRKIIIEACKCNDIKSNLLKKSVVSDEREISQQRIDEINQKIEEFEYNECARVEKEKEKLESQYNNEIKKLNMKLVDLTDNCSILDKEIEDAEKILIKEKANDKRKLLFKILKSTSEVKEAKKQLKQLKLKKKEKREELYRLYAQKKILEDRFTELYASIEKIPYPMTEKESKDLREYQLLLDILIQKGGSHAS
ncbi:hypothetical protein [uncultured Granulicatella sp.]|uniref:hypothetical protein n=1 Tax=uncultured Granulicatella sp. TaxID=316089 RepID=UPI0028D85812|nr:hypothetical protein [uncultured Granulicatella sp.]